MLNPKKASNKKMEKKKAGAILKISSLFIDEFIKMMKNSQILVNPKKYGQEKNAEKKNAEGISGNSNCAHQKNKIAQYKNADAILRIPKIVFTTNCA